MDKVIENSRLMKQVSEESIEMIIPCFKPVTKYHKSGDIIIEYNFEPPKQVALILEGSAKLEIVNEKGSVFLLETYNKDDVFGDIFVMPMNQFMYTVTATSDCVIMYLDYNHIISPCANLCNHHSQILSNLFMMTAHKTQNLSMHISILGQSTIRDKLLAYLNYECSNTGICHDGYCNFQISMSLTKLAEYLNVDRSAMMRELKAMKEEGILNSNRRFFTILENIVF